MTFLSSLTELTQPDLMNLIATDQAEQYEALAGMLEGIAHPAILLDAGYRILAYNDAYRLAFGAVDPDEASCCYQVSHGYDRPCDEAGEDCPLGKVKATGRRERLLHIHQTHNGPEHIEVELLPLARNGREAQLFVEVMKPVPLASGGASEQTLLGKSPVFTRMLDRIARVGPSDAAVLLLGESGTGKELVAKAIHASSGRRDRPLITLECSGLTDTLFESELFGYSRGAFTGANSNKKGLVELADGGTLFLDEIADVPLSMQVKLLRLLENRTFRALGSTEVKTSNFRLICATHKNIRQLVDAGQFRLDLYHRINVFPIRLPSLQERRQDVPLIAAGLLSQLDPEGRYRLTEAAEQFLCGLTLQGNIRELRNILNRAVVLCSGESIDAALLRECVEEDLHGKMVTPASAADSWVDLKTQEQRYLSAMLEAFDGDRVAMAKVLGISLRSLYRKLAEDRRSG